MKQKFFALDIGSKLLKFCIGEEDEQGSLIILTRQSKNIESFSDGEIIDYDLFKEEIIETVKNISSQVSETPTNLLISFSASYFISQKSKGRISVSDRYVSQEDIKKTHLLAKASLASTSYEILFEEPISYSLDNLNIKVRDPLGMEARTLEVDFLIIQGLKSMINKVKDIFENSNLKPSLILPNPLPASYVLIPKKEKETGVILVDFGYRVFNISIFQEGKIVFFQNLKFGFGDIIEDLAINFSVSAEEINLIFEQINSSAENKKKMKIRLGKQSLTYLNFIKLFEKYFSNYAKKNNLLEMFKKIKEDFRIPAGIYLIGAGSYVPEIDVLLKKYCGYPVKIENDQQKILNFKERIFLNTLGLMFYYQRIFENKSFFENLWESLKSFFK